MENFLQSCRIRRTDAPGTTSGSRDLFLFFFSCVAENFPRNDPFEYFNIRPELALSWTELRSHKAFLGNELKVNSHLKE